jgi:hypothetical protein
MKSADVIDFAPYKAKQMVNVFSNTGKIDLGDHIKHNQINFDTYLDYLDRATNHEYQPHFVAMIIQHAKNSSLEHVNEAINEGRDLIKNLGFFKYDFQSSLIPESVFEKNQIVYLFGELERILYKPLDKLDEIDYDYINLVYEHKDALSSIFKTTIQEFGDYIYKWKHEPRVVNTIMMMTESRNYLFNCAGIMNKILEIHQEM